MAALILLAIVAGLRAWLVDQPWTVAAWAALGAGVMIGIGMSRAIATRLAFHASDGLLAADALHPRSRRRYRVAWHGVGLASLAAVSLIARPSLLPVSVSAYLAGAHCRPDTTGMENSGMVAPPDRRNSDRDVADPGVGAAPDVGTRARAGHERDDGGRRLRCRAVHADADRRR
ncbi:hypothetical protein [Sphingomonas sp. Leaf17]|uniref:hypothetical protein n=1 Tax=Sphingomonas sp. Leaf17 TaxID=1735683 RepID=UPI001F2CD213|nr:hypothetical protein [Sphingomonas sp. Leaf17]